ncbi:uncharacterized protein [Aristolochia californica]|uniref:uncharacterized protein isoform X2 n=1 Tax=Aristolochia californica TaxID=171875 RepID=UPI0035E0A2AC
MQILTTLRRNLDTPVTCKIRLLKSPQDTVELARRIEKTGVSTLAVHGRALCDCGTVEIVGPIASTVEDVMYAAMLGSSSADRISLNPVISLKTDTFVICT